MLTNDSHEVEVPYEAFVVATKRADGKLPKFEKVLGSEDCTFGLYATEEEAGYILTYEKAKCEVRNMPCPYAIFKVHVTLVEEEDVYRNTEE